MLVVGSISGGAQHRVIFDIRTPSRRCAPPLTAQTERFAEIALMNAPCATGILPVSSILMQNTGRTPVAQ